MSAITSAIDQLITGWFEYHDPNNLPWIEHDPEWSSACEILTDITNATKERVQWRPVKRDEPGSFNHVGHALGESLDPEFCVLYSTYWCGHLNLHHEKGPLTLLQVWNQDDFENLQKNLIGHALMKRQLKQELTLFFALTDEEDLIISVLNKTGEVVLEHVGKEPHFKLADSLSEFLNALSFQEKETGSTR